MCFPHPSTLLGMIKVYLNLEEEMKMVWRNVWLLEQCEQGWMKDTNTREEVRKIEQFWYLILKICDWVWLEGLKNSLDKVSYQNSQVCFSVWYAPMNMKTVKEKKEIVKF